MLRIPRSKKLSTWCTSIRWNINMNVVTKIIAATNVLILFNLVFASSTPIVKNVYNGGGLHYEGPHWSATENALYWVDMDDNKLFRYDYETNNVTSRSIGYGSVSLVVTVKDYPRVVLVTARAEVYLMHWDDFQDDTSLRQLSAIELGLPDNTANDGKVDAMGRLWFGSKGGMGNNMIPSDQATLYMLDQYNYQNPEIKVRPVSISNGIAWSGDNKLMFYIDSLTRAVEVFDFDLETAAISNRRTIFDLREHNITGGTDGMTIDTDDNLWLALLNGWKVLKIDSKDGRLLEEYTLPVQKVASVMFGGPDLSILYVTTGRSQLTQAQLDEQPEAGSIFAIEGTGARGRPENQFVFPDAANF